MDSPEELVSLVQERRIIPFIGAGFSAGLGLPEWEGMLRLLASQTEDVLPFDEILEYAGHDLLQVAEYLYLKSDRHIGPIRHALEQGLTGAHSPMFSAAHVELVNLGAPQVYTTNYDDILETTYRSLNLPFTTVVLPKDVALADTKRTQIVKYHGDLRHESTLVLTESSYYKRLDFESPMDLKFRSDLLGRSVLFMGYSFRDINIRIIWFKLMEMMRDIPEADRRPSYIIRTEANPVLEDLYRAVGLRTIVLSNGSRRLTPEDRMALLGDFLLRLGEAATGETGNIPGQSSPRFLSTAGISRTRRRIEEMREVVSRTIRRRFPPLVTPLLTEPINRIMQSRVPQELVEEAKGVLGAALSAELVAPDDDTLPEILKRFGGSPEATEFVVGVLTRAGGEKSERHKLLANEALDWEQVWSYSISFDAVDRVADRLDKELEWVQSESFDEDLAYVADVAKRITLGQILSAKLARRKAVKRLETSLNAASELIPSIATHEPDPKGRPDVAKILAQIEERNAQDIREKGIRIRRPRRSPPNTS